MKLYWRYKKAGKWTWKPVPLADNLTDFLQNLAETRSEAEEEE